jgi:ArsR family transcriptional regulator
MKDKEIYKLHADFCKFMGNPKRIEILFLLGNNERCVDELAKEMGVSITNVSQNLSIMKSKNVVEFRREGTRIYYKLSNRRILEACIIMRDIMLEQAQKKVKAFTRNK